jgi:hypothetical protein
MRSVKLWTAVAGVAVTLAAGACSNGTKPSAHPATTAVTPAGQMSSTPTTPLTPDAATKLVLGLNSQIQQAVNTPTGPRALSRADAQAIVDGINRQLGITVPKK